MNRPIFQSQSLKTRITVTTLAVLLLGIWSLAFYVSQLLRDDMTKLLSEQQFSTASFVAAAINGELQSRVAALERTAEVMDASLLSNPASSQAFLDQRIVLQTLFNGGLRVQSVAAIAGDAALQDIVATLSDKNRTVIGRPVLDPVHGQPGFPMVTAIFDARGTVRGVLAGITHLGKPGFLDKMTAHHYGAGHGYLLLVAPQHRLIVTASDKRRIMEPLLPPGVNPAIDRFVNGAEGTGIVRNPSGVEVLAAVRGVPAAGWYVALLMPTAELFAPIQRMYQRLLLATLLLTLLAAGLIGWVLKNQLSPLFAAARTLAAMSASDQLPQPLPVTRPDEIGQLITGFNRVLAMLNQREMALKEGASQLKLDYTSLQRILDALPVGIWIGDCQGNLKLNNPAGREIWEGERWVGMTGYGEYKGWWSDTGKPLAPEDWGMARAVMTGEKSVDEMVDIECFDGSRKTILNSAQIIFDVDGKPNCALVVNQDITQIKAVQDELMQVRRQLEALSGQLLAVQERERHELSRELHDEIGQSLTALKITLETARRRIPPAEIDAALIFAIKVADSLVVNIRDIARGLRPPQIDELGLLPALRWHIDQITQTANLPIGFEWNIGEWRFPPALELGCFRVAQECITNIIRHARATDVKVTLMLRDGRLHLTVRDNGIGFDANRLHHASVHQLPLGLLGMRERIAGLHGELHIYSAPGAGAEICAIFPLEVLP
jgi:signal transduction histidine kinase